MKKLNLLGLSMVAMVALAGCGGGSSSPKTGTGYYVDSAVAGVKYECGSKSGTTDKEGKFTFEEGKECKFSLAGIPLRRTPADELADGKKVVEDNPKVAKFLQSIDKDGDLSNGIEIDDAVLEALTKALEEQQSEGKLPEGDTLVEVVANVGHDVEGVSGEVRTDTEVQEHLTQTQTEITKALLAGKTFYVIGEDGDDREIVLFKLIVNQDATQFTSSKLDGTNTDTMNISIVGNKMTFTNDTDGSYSLISQENGYVFADDRNADGTKDGVGHRLYASQADAQAYYDSLQPSSTNKTLTELIVGKTLYEKCGDRVDSVTFNSNGTLSYVDNGKTETENYRIDGNVMYTVEEGKEKSHTLSEQTDKYIKFNDNGKYTTTLYFNRADAEAASSNDCGGGSDTPNTNISKFTTEYLKGKTFYDTYLANNTDESGKWEVAVFTFTENKLSAYSLNDPKDKMEPTPYEITSEGFIKFQPSYRDDGKSEYVGIKSSTEDYLKIGWTEHKDNLLDDRDDNGGYFFFDEEKAKAFVDEKNKNL